MAHRINSEARRIKEKATPNSKAQGTGLETLSPTEQVLRQFRAFVPQPPASLSTGPLQNGISEEIQPHQQPTGLRFPDSVKEVTAEVLETRRPDNVRTTSYDWSKPVVKSLPYKPRYQAESQTASYLSSAVCKCEVIPEGYRNISVASTVRETTSFWQSISWPEYILYLAAIIFVSLSLFYPGGVNSFGDDLISLSKQGISGEEEPAAKQTISGKQHIQPAKDKPQKMLERKREPNVMPSLSKEAEQSGVVEIPLPPAVEESLRHRLEESAMPVESPEATPNWQGLVNEINGFTSRGSAPHSNQPLRAGTRIALELVVGLRSDANMTASVRITADIFDRDGRVLIPAGTTISIPFIAVPSLQRMINDPAAKVYFDLTDGRQLSIQGEVKDTNGYVGIEGKLHKRSGQSFLNKLLRSTGRVAARALIRSKDFRDTGATMREELGDGNAIIRDRGILEARAGTKFFFQVR